VTESINLTGFEKLAVLATYLQKTAKLKAVAIMNIMEYISGPETPENEIARMQLIRACRTSRNIMIALAQYGATMPDELNLRIEKILVARRTKPPRLTP